ncbi:MAG: hypothetical protein ACLQUY_02800 [Ktedonobacterales bacterium]
MSGSHNEFLYAQSARQAWMGESMGLTSPFDTAGKTDPTILGSNLSDIGMSELRPPQSPIRFGGLTMDLRTGVTHWRGRALELSLDERELLGVLLRHAGQILSTARFGALLNAEVAQIDDRMSALAARLKQQGVTCLPYQATGLGYILWRS